MNKEKLKEALEFARENNLPFIEVEGVKITVPPKEDPTPEADIKQPETPYDRLSDDEILFWSTPTYDELQARKEHQEKTKHQDEDTRS